jgi:hypothetical protein
MTEPRVTDATRTGTELTGTGLTGTGLTGTGLTVRDLARRSQAAAGAKDRETWLGLFTPDAVVEDPIAASWESSGWRAEAVRER